MRMIYGAIIGFVDYHVTSGMSVRCVRNVANRVYSGHLDPVRPEVPRVYIPYYEDSAAVKVSGGRSRADIISEMRRSSPQLEYAYAERWRERPGLMGKFVLKFAIDQRGNAVSAVIHSKYQFFPCLNVFTIETIIIIETC